MQRQSWSMRDAKNHFSTLVAAARRAPQTVTKRGQPVAVIIDATEYERLLRLERARAPSFKDHLLAMPRDGGTFERMEEC